MSSDQPVENAAEIPEASKEQQILYIMRKVLSSVARDTAPTAGRPTVLHERTVADIRMCLGLITSRERELSEQQGHASEARPHFTDEAKITQNVSVAGLKPH